VGTEQSSTLLVNVFVPTEDRSNQSVFAAPAGDSVLRHRNGGAMLCTAVLNRDGCLLDGACESLKAHDPDTRLSNRVLTRSTTVRATSSSDEATPVNTDSPSGDCQLLLTVSEKQIRVIGLPTHSCYVEQKMDQVP